ncbi:Helicase ARIP4 [Bagarius yarrelli]|uniref:Helicase ARIP4 n=1 Tax=Bagarius yarrelli TaxID=175774 RepID=A0A556VTU8_BAGYA|nr:Helicase ARIP4 [Bagarius yarrelli]
MSEEAISESDLEHNLNSEEEEEEERMAEEADEENDADDDEDDNMEEEDDEAGQERAVDLISSSGLILDLLMFGGGGVFTDRTVEHMEGEEGAGLSSPTHSSRSGSSAPSSRPQSRSSSKSTSRPSSPNGSHAASVSTGSAPKRKSKKKSSKPAKPAHLRRNIRKLLEEHQLEPGTKAAQQEELERRKRLEQQRKDYPLPADVIELSSGDEELFHLSEEDDEHATSPGTEESSGSHINDALNQLDAQGRVLVNINHPAEEEDLFLGPQLARAVKPHQVYLALIPHIRIHTSHSGPSLTRYTLHSHPYLTIAPKPHQVYLAPIPHAHTHTLQSHPNLTLGSKPHKIGGIRFLYDNLVESLERYKTSSGFGCILAHSMGLGKTLQVISFIDILLRHTGARTVLAIVPVNTLQNWLAEFNLWLPASESLPPDTDPAQVSPRTFKVHLLNDEHKTTVSRAKVIEEWTRDGGVLLMGYEMYRLLSLKKSFVTGRKRKSKKPAGPIIIDLDEEDRQQELMKESLLDIITLVLLCGEILNGRVCVCVCVADIEKALSQPGPDVVICDEGHRIKNCHASTSQALKNIRSRRRVVLTGYPLQNNLMEYWCMVDFVRPDFLGTRQEFSNMFERPILNGQCIDSTPHDVRLMRYRSHVLHSLLEGFVQRRGHDVLSTQLPVKEEHVILVRLSPLQTALYKEFMNRFREAGNSGWLGLNPLKAFCVCCKIWNHPDVLYETLQKENLANEQDLDLDDLNATATGRCSAPGLKGKASDGAGTKGSLAPLQERANQVITYEWEVESLLHYVEEEPDPSQSELLLNDDMEAVIKHACLRFPHLITKLPFQHESLLMDRKELKLTKAEKKAAKKSYEDEKRASVPYQRPSYAHYYPVNEQNIVIPGTNSSTDVQARISAGESIHVIKGSKGTYIRTNDGRIFAIRSGKPRANVGAAPATRDMGGSLLRSVSNGRSSPPELKRFSIDGERRVSPSSSPNLLHQLHHYTPTTASNLALSDLPDRPTQHGHTSELQRRGDLVSSGSTLDVQSLKRKLLSDSRGSKRTTSTTNAANFPSFPVSTGYNMGSMSYSPALLGALGHMPPPVMGGTNRGHYLNDLHSMFPTSALSSAHDSSSSSTSITASSSAPSSSSSSTSSSSIPPFLFNPSMANMLSGFPVPYTQPLLPDSSRMFSNSLSSSVSAPTSAAPSSFLSSSSLLGAALSRADTQHALAEKGGSSSDDDVIEVTGQ